MFANLHGLYCTRPIIFHGLAIIRYTHTMRVKNATLQFYNYVVCFPMTRMSLTVYSNPVIIFLVFRQLHGMTQVKASTQ